MSPGLTFFKKSEWGHDWLNNVKVPYNLMTAWFFDFCENFPSKQFKEIHLWNWFAEETKAQRDYGVFYINIHSPT